MQVSLQDESINRFRQVHINSLMQDDIPYHSDPNGIFADYLDHFKLSPLDGNCYQTYSLPKKLYGIASLNIK